MSLHETDLSQHRFPWLRSGFDLEGWVGALAAWLVGILLGIVWGPLFWIGVAAAVLILMATRTSHRSPPGDVDLIVTPTDGTLVSIGGATPPDELRLEGEKWTRLRISVGPMTSNGLYAPMDGAIDHIIRETGDPAAIAAMRPDRAGLSVIYVALESGARALGMRLATGGLGPRLELLSEPGDAVRLGRQIGILRLGGWCDLYVPEGARITAWPGQTLIGSETVLASFAPDPRAESPAEATAAETPAGPAQTASSPKPRAKSRAKPKPKAASKAAPKAKASAKPRAKAPQTAEPVSEAKGEPEPGAEEDDLAERLARLRETAGGGDSDLDPEAD